MKLLKNLSKIGRKKTYKRGRKMIKKNLLKNVQLNTEIKVDLHLKNKQVKETK